MKKKMRMYYVYEVVNRRNEAKRFELHKDFGVIQGNREFRAVMRHYNIASACRMARGLGFQPLVIKE